VATTSPFSPDDLDRALALVEPRMRSLLVEAEGRITSPLPLAVVARRFAGVLPDEPLSWPELERRLDEDVLRHTLRLHHRGYAGHQVAVPLPLAAAVDGLAALLNQMAALSDMAPSGAMVERQVVRSLAHLVGFDERADGVCTSGGSVSNLIAILAARNQHFPEIWQGGSVGIRPRAFISEDAHYSVSRAFGITGLGTDCVRPIAANGAGEMVVADLATAIGDSLRAGERPFLVVAGAPNTPIGAFDPLPEIADVCREHDLWLHVDAAHGGGFLFSDRLRTWLDGLARADSVSMDGHKMLFQPSSQGWVLFRDGGNAYRAFRQAVPYLLGPDGQDTAFDAIGKSLQCTRRLDALKLWVSWQAYGRKAFGDWVEQCVAAARAFHRLLAEHGDFESIHEPACNIVCFRARHPNGDHVDGFHDEIRAKLLQQGRGWVVLTTYRGQRLLRTAWMNPTQGEAEAAALVDALAVARASVLAAT
jgi:L-2,4-diaminobutyrate decarboxylase